MFEKLFRRKSKPVGELTTDFDPERPYLSGLLLRFDEDQADSVSFFTKLNPSFRSPPIPEGTSESERGGLAAYSSAMVMAVEAMGAQGKLMLDGERTSILEGAIGISYAMLILTLLSSYLKDDGVELDSKLWGDLPVRFAELFIWLDDAKRKELATRGLEIFKNMLESNHPKLTEWHDTLSKAVRIWLISATPDKRTKGYDKDLRKVFNSYLGALYEAIEFS